MIKPRLFFQADIDQQAQRLENRHNIAWLNIDISALYFVTCIAGNILEYNK